MRCNQSYKGFTKWLENSNTNTNTVELPGFYKVAKNTNPNTVDLSGFYKVLRKYKYKYKTNTNTNTKTNAIAHDKFEFQHVDAPSSL